MADASDVTGEFATRVTAGQISWAGDFAATMSAIEHTLTVRLIMAQPLVTLEENQRVSEVLDEDSNALFDCFPVRGKGNAVVGAVFREDTPSPDALATDVMRRFTMCHWSRVASRLKSSWRVCAILRNSNGS